MLLGVGKDTGIVASGEMRRRHSGGERSTNNREVRCLYQAYDCIVLDGASSEPSCEGRCEVVALFLSLRESGRLDFATTKSAQDVLWVIG